MPAYIQVMVPEEQLAAVYRVLLSAHGPGALGPDPQPREGMPPTAGGGWRDPAFVRTHLGGRSETIRGLAKYLADRPGQAVTAEAAAEALGLRYGWNSLAGALGAFGNYLANRGIEFPWSSITDASDERVRWTLDTDTAIAVTQAL
jgi:hypothetical protein